MDILEMLTDIVYTFFNKLLLLGGIILTFIINMCGGNGKELYLLVVFVLFDYTTGVIKGFCLGNISSKMGIKGIIKKSMLFLAVAVGHHLDLFFNYTDTIRTLIISMLIINEVFSIIENFEALGIPMPNSLKKMLKQYKENEDKKD